MELKREEMALRRQELELELELSRQELAMRRDEMDQT